MDISPDKQNVDRVFSNTTYYIDFYQRDYKWTEEPVKRLLDDIFYVFNQEYEEKADFEPSKEIIMVHYPWYYLNTYVTNTIAGKVFVVDGQQRLTTLSLVLIKLFHLAGQNDSKLQDWLKSKIAGHAGYDNEFWMCHEQHKKIQEALFTNRTPTDLDLKSGITAQNMNKNYQLISQFLDNELNSKHKFDTFVFYFLYRVVLINLAVEQTHVPMVFEVINDRGVRLKPYEILKGKLLGQINKVELDKDNYNELWEKQVSVINDFYESDEIDDFFRHYLRAKFSNNRKEGQKFDGDYHREMFNNGIDQHLQLNHNEAAVKKFLKNEFIYYSNLYLKVLNHYDEFNNEQPYVYYNRLNDLDGQFMLILSVCELNDEREEEKMRGVSFEFDRLFVLLQLQNIHDSNKFTELSYAISSEIRGKAPEMYRAVFDKYLMATIAENRGTQITSPLHYAYFRNTGLSLNMRFKRYFFARIEKFLADNLNLKMKHHVYDLVARTGAKTGFHVEHILSHNDENLALFDNDEEVFDRERDRLGGILLLKGKDNISSNNEPYSEKLKTYANTLYWNETLREDSYKSKLDMRELKNKYDLDLEPLDVFGPDELEKRHKLLYDIIKIIWDCN